MSSRISRLLAAMTCAASLSVYAADEANEQSGSKHRQPPQAALDACKNSTESATCQFTGRDNEAVSGTCAAPPHSDDKSMLACRPDRKDWKAKDGEKKDHANH